MRRRFITAVLVTCLGQFGTGMLFATDQSAKTVFAGRPIVKVSEGGIERLADEVSSKDAVNLECVISRIGEEYYWASRRNTPMVLVDSGAFLTYNAVNGSGYVRIVKPESKTAASSMSETERRYDYVEHVLIGLRSVTYFGSRQAP